jgi:hypothetical protein
MRLDEGSRVPSFSDFPAGYRCRPRDAHWFEHPTKRGRAFPRYHRRIAGKKPGARLEGVGRTAGSAVSASEPQ